MEKKLAKPNKTLERTSGLGASLLTALSVITLGLDWISRGQTMMDLYPYVHSPLLQLGVIIAAVITIIRATKLEQIREDDEAPRIITDGILTAGARELRKPKRHRCWIKLSCASAIVSIIAISLFAWWHHRHLHKSDSAIMAQRQPAPTQLTSANMPAPTPVVPKKSNTLTPTSPTPKPGVAQGTTAPITAPPTAQQIPLLSVPTPQQPTTPPPPNSGCPKETGKMTGDWSMNTGSNMMMGGYNLNYSFDQTIVHSFFTLLQQSISPSTKPLTRAQLVKAINLSDDVQSHLPKPAPIRIEQNLISPDLTLVSIRRSFLQNSDYLQFSYSAHLPNGQDVGNTTDQLLIKSLSLESQRTISEFDQMTKAWGDDACRDAVNRLTKQQ